jgi:hypothetical protein
VAGPGPVVEHVVVGVERDRHGYILAQQRLPAR